MQTYLNVWPDKKVKHDFNEMKLSNINHRLNPSFDKYDYKKIDCNPERLKLIEFLV